MALGEIAAQNAAGAVILPGPGSATTKIIEAMDIGSLPGC
jgi:hypothetical protein